MVKKTFLLLLFIVSSIFSQVDNKNYYPFAVGNKWVYESHGHYSENIAGAILVYPWDSQLSVEVVDTVSSNEKVFELLVTKENIFNGNFETMTWYETYYEGCEVYSSYSLLYLFNDYEKRFDLCSVPGDSAQFKFFDYRFSNQQITLYHKTDSTINILGENSTSQNFVKITDEGLYNLTLAQDFGLIEQHGKTTDSNWESHLTLKGAVIDGVVYGDTSLIVSVEDEEYIPNKFSLSQNYPNPFNPTTRIKYQVASIENVSLKVYDILGREIKTLLNKQLQPGEYEVEFDGSDLPSGVYFYSLQAGNYIQSRKMVLLK